MLGSSLTPAPIIQKKKTAEQIKNIPLIAELLDISGYTLERSYRLAMKSLLKRFYVIGYGIIDFGEMSNLGQLIESCKTLNYVY